MGAQEAPMIIEYLRYGVIRAVLTCAAIFDSTR
jgi:hypothetical protein